MSKSQKKKTTLNTETNMRLVEKQGEMVIGTFSIISSQVVVVVVVVSRRDGDFENGNTQTA